MGGVVSRRSIGRQPNGTNAYVTKDTAPIYGLKASDFTATPKRLALDATQRPGFLTRAGFLSTFSHAAASSPILRGAFISQRVLGIPVGTPDPSFVGMSPPPGNYTTNRQATEALTSTGACVACHPNKVNPPGFVLEHFDAVGAWQDKDALGGDIDATADVMLAVGTVKTISTPSELMAAIAGMPNAQRTYAWAWAAYATGRSPNSHDACVVDVLSKNLASGSYSVSSMLADYTQADSFRERIVGN